MNSTSKAVSVLVVALAGAYGCAREISYQADIYPILKDNCLECHANGGEGYTKSGFSVESYEGVLKGTKYGPVVVPGSSVSSTLARLVQGKADPSIAMPHNKHPLEPDEVELLVQWIDQGAKKN